MPRSRTPSVDLGLENASIPIHSCRHRSNEHLQTSARHIYAAGDVLGHSRHTHCAARKPCRRAQHPHENTCCARLPPRPATFTFPGVASVGLSEDDCLKRYLPINKATAPLSIIARSNTSDFHDGFVKVITDKRCHSGVTTVITHHMPPGNCARTRPCSEVRPDRQPSGRYATRVLSWVKLCVSPVEN